MHNILIVAAQEESLGLLRGVLERHGCAVETARHGAEALAKARQNPPHAIVSDLLMPVMDGYTLLRRWRNDERLKSIPFIVYTANYADPGDEKLPMELGADAVIVKPAGPETLLVRVREVIEKARHKELTPRASPADEPIGRYHSSEILVRPLEEKRSELEQANRELAAGEARLRAIFDTGPECVKLLDADGSLLEMNPAGLRMLDADSFAEVKDRCVYPLVTEEHRAAFRELIARVFQGETGKLEFQIVGLKGRRRWLETHASPLREAGGAITALIGVTRDITERKRTEAALRESEDRFAAFMATMPLIAFIKDTEGRLLYVNDAFERAFGMKLADWKGKTDAELWPPETARQLRENDVRILAGGQPVVVEEIVERPTGTECWMSHKFPLRDAQGRLYLAGTAFDITERKRLQEQFLRGQRTEAIGTLAGGIAHDFNNILAPVMMGACLLQERVTDPADRSLLKMIQKSAERGSNVVRQLLTFSRGIEGKRVSVQLRHLLQEMFNLMRETFPRELALDETVASDLWVVNADPTQLHQVLLNLCLNARDAMPSGGTLKVEARNAELSAADVQSHPPAKAGPHVVLVVSDTGQGIPPAIINRIFDPFFTTKEPGKGTGLGLSTAVGIVRSHDGFMTVASTPDKGTVFTVYLPAVPAAERSVLSPAARRAPKGNGELILVVDDESPIREATRLLLEAHRYTVMTAINGAEAATLFFRHEQKVRLVVTDLMMPHEGGMPLIRTLRAKAPGVRLVVVSGLIDKAIHAEVTAAGVTCILEKPFLPADLLEAIHAQLHGP